MDFVPFDRTPGLTPEEIATLRKLRYSDEGRLLIRVLTEAPPLRAVTAVGGLAEHDHSYLLGRRECLDSFLTAFRLIGSPDDPIPTPAKAKYPSRLKPQNRPESADAS